MSLTHTDNIWHIQFSAAIANFGLIAALFFVKVGAKFLGVLPLARFVFRYRPSSANYLTLMMATGLTFGTISSLYGLTHHYIDEAQYTALVTVVILTAIIPAAIAQALFKPSEEPEEMEAEVP
jgi:Kef-type K+ transport system membrane component KefB